MHGPVSKLTRCAIYTRKSTEHNLDLAFTSLDAQREACVAYITSQAGEGWRLVSDHYDDGGLSGASLERPALQRLLADVRAGKIDIVLVYKVDRLTRALADFAKLIELFEAHRVSFVSVTQSFNTRSSMGRLTLNVLLSFAQFERELIGERVRDKIAASKRKGLWVGGPVPLGYAAVDKKIVVVPAEAEVVRTIFERYLELGSIRMLVADLDHKGIRSKPRQLSNGRLIGGGAFGVGALAYLLKNRFYIGEVVYRGEVHRGDHAPILNRPLFEAVQAKLAVQTVARRCRLRGSPALLTGRLFDDRGHCMSPSHTNKGGVRYRYYVSQAVLQGKPHTAGSVGRVPAAEVEAFVSAAVRKHLSASALGEVPARPADCVQPTARSASCSATSARSPKLLRATLATATSAPAASKRSDTTFASSERSMPSTAERVGGPPATPRVGHWAVSPETTGSLPAAAAPRCRRSRTMLMTPAAPRARHVPARPPPEGRAAPARRRPASPAPTPAGSGQ